ncbi:MAG: LpxL/LpxP family Kdo(2)-lipid IV(A) lauroyl/palmitoleoyl acyltransferase [Cellvibrionaceae bacterium]
MDTTRKPEFTIALLHPRYWPNWLWFGLWWLVSQLPYRVQLKLGEWLGRGTYRLFEQRRYIARRNIDLCFPHLADAERERMVRDNFIATATAVFETGMAWFWSRRRLQKLYTIEGAERLQSRIAQGEGMLLLTLHFTTLELMGAAVTGMVDSIAMSYRPHRNPVYDLIQSRQRSRHNKSAVVVAAGDVRGMVRYLKKGYATSYLPDQDYGPKHSVFVPLFGIPAATVTGMARLAKLARVPVIPIVNFRRADGQGYVVRILPPLENFPSGDDQRDARQINAHVEKVILDHPEQYLWVHRRFKSRPPGEADLYQLPKSRSRSRRRRRRRPMAG